MTTQVINSQVHKTSKIYEGARVKNSILGEKTVVGNFSRVDNSTLHQFVRIDRNNHIVHSKIERHTYTGINTVIMHAEIASFCSISWNVTIGGANHDYTRMTQHSFLYNDYDNIRHDDHKIPYNRFKDKLIIKNDVWIAAGANITRGVTIHEGAVIGANSVVTHDIPPYAIAVGVPAKVIKYRFDDEIIELLLRIKWWNWSKNKISKYFNILSEKPTAETLFNLMKENT